MQEGSKISVQGEYQGSPKTLPELDYIIAATGQRPNWQIVQELRLEIDSSLDSVKPLAPLIDPNVHSCGSVRAHGAIELAHSEENYYAIGSKSYGRAPNFLLATGYEQARSVAAMISGDIESATHVELNLPETGVCSSTRTTKCC